MTKAKTNYIAIIGTDSNDRKLAAKFPASQLEAVQKAAEAMKLSVAQPKSPEALKLILKLPAGKLQKNGIARVQLYKGIYDDLVGALIPSDHASGKEEPDDMLPVLWQDLKKGSIVVAPEFAPQENGWWKGEILSITPDKRRVTLRWLFVGTSLHFIGHPFRWLAL